MIKPIIKFVFIFLSLFFYINFCEISALAIDYNPNGPFFGQNGTLTIASDANFGQPDLTFSYGNTVYIKVETTSLTNSNGSNSYELFDYLGNSLLSGTFSQISTSSPYIYTASFIYPNNADYTQLKINLTSSTNQKFTIQQTLEPSSGNNYMRLYSDSSYIYEKYVFKSSDIIYMKAYGNTWNPKIYNQDVYGFDGTIYSLSDYQYDRNGNWYTLPITINLLSLPDQKWYWLYAESVFKENNRANFYAGRMFLLDNTNPTAIITYPTANSNLPNNLTITGTASDISFASYTLSYENQNNPGIWNLIRTNNIAQIIDGTLSPWNTSFLPAGIYNLKLEVTDQAGNTSNTIVTNLTKIIYSGAFSVTAPSSAGLTGMIVSSNPQTSTGRIGNNTGSNDITVTDDRGTFSGWSLTMTMSDFYSGTQVLPVTGMTITPTDITATSGSLENVSKGSLHTFSSDSDPASVMYASPGYGTGIYWNDVLLEYEIPSFPVAGYYSATINFSIQ